jgi:DNA-binding PadR family transcriptional regulator
VAPGFAYQRAAILVLMGLDGSTADELTLNLADLGFGHSTTSKLRYVLRVMELEGLIRCARSPGASLTPRYTTTDVGHDYLRRVTPALVEYRDALDAMILRYPPEAGARSPQPNR